MVKTPSEEDPIVATSARLRMWIPADLPCDTRISPLAKYLYMLIDLKKPASISELSRLSGLGRQLVRKECRALAEAGWATIVSKPGQTVVLASIPAPTQEALALRLKDDRWAAAYSGEFLMKAWLDLLVDSDNYVDNCRPAFLAHPATGQLLEYDRYYREGVAFEYNGRQHYETTSQYPNEEDLNRLQLRDHIRAALSQKNNVMLVEVTDADLSLAGMRSKIPDVLPARPVDEDGPYVRMLTRLSEEYTSSCKRARSRDRKNDRSSG